jgi:type I restriction enzyme S subunit
MEYKLSDTLRFFILCETLWLFFATSAVNCFACLTAKNAENFCESLRTLRLDFLPQRTQSCSQRTQSKLIKRIKKIKRVDVMKFEKLKNIVEVKKGKKPSFVETPGENSVRVLQIDDLRNDTNPKFTNDKTGVFAKEDDILIAWDGANAGTIGYGKSGYIGSTIALLRKKQPELYSTTFIGIFLQSQYQYLRSRTTGATIPHISRKALDDLEIPVISVNAQLHIATILSKAENLIAQRKESIRLLDEFLKSTFLEMFGDPVRNEKGWKIDSLKNYGSLKNGLNYTRNESGLNIRCLGVGDFKDLSKLTDIDSLPILNLSSAPSDEYYLQDGDLVFVRSNGNRELVGRCLVVFPKKDKVTYSGFCIRYRIEKTQITSIYLSHLFRVSVFKKSMLQNGRGANIQNINQQILGSLKIPVPPISLQTQFAQIVEKTEALKSQYQQSLQELESLYGSLSQKAFRGELTSKQNSANP